MSDLNPYPGPYYGQILSREFKDAWRAGEQVAGQRPWQKVMVRRGYMNHSLHSSWPPPHPKSPATVASRRVTQFGQVIGFNIKSQWFPDWTPTTDWVELPGVHQCDLDQQVNFAGTGGNGITVATLVVDNLAWQDVAGSFGAYHQKERGWLWPWRGYIPMHRPEPRVAKNQWYDQLPNAQILIQQGYGESTAVKTFTGLIDKVSDSIRPDRANIVARDFGGALVDQYVFAWNKDNRMNDPIYFVPPSYPKQSAIPLNPKIHNWVVVNDATDVVRCALRWSGFKEYEVEDSGVQLKTPYVVDRSKTWMDVINDAAQQLGYVFFIAEPSGDDLSIGVPVFRKQAVITGERHYPTAPSVLLTDVEPVHDNSNDRLVVRVRGAVATRKQGGRTIIGNDPTIDGTIRFTATYFPPWLTHMSGIIKQFTYYNIGANGVFGFASDSECMVAAILVAIQIAMLRDTGSVQIPGYPGIGLDSMLFLNDEFASGIVGRLYVTARHSTMTRGGDGSSGSTPSNGPGAGGADQLIWDSQITGALVDNPEWDRLRKDYATALAGGAVRFSGPGNTRDYT